MLKYLYVALVLFAAMACDESDSAHDGDSQAEVVVYTISGNVEAEEVDALISEGWTWSELDDAGLIEVEQRELVEIPERSDVNQGHTKGSDVVVASATVSSVSPGSYVNITFGVAPSACYAVQGHAWRAGTSRRTTTGYVKAESWRKASGHWELKKSTTPTDGFWQHSVWAGAAATHVRAKVFNKALSYSHKYTVYLFLDAPYVCGH